MNPFDRTIIAFLNRLAGRSWSADELVHQLSSNYLLKTALLSALLYWTWFRRNDDGRRRDRRATLVFGLVASCAAVIVTRILSFALPFRERPLRAPGLHFVVPLSVSSHAINAWSAFPSDNATLFFGVALTIFLVSRRAGIVAFCHVLLVVAFARVYLGYHYPTDILGGAALGMGAVALGFMPRVKSAVTAAPMRWLDRNPQAFQTALCVLV
ncbi:MAG: phosphatase PAP2 family protein, partial [Verrucomicrobiota bacterium]